MRTLASLQDIHCTLLFPRMSHTCPLAVFAKDVRCNVLSWACDWDGRQSVYIDIFNSIAYFVPSTSSTGNNIQYCICTVYKSIKLSSVHSHLHLHNSLVSAQTITTMPVSTAALSLAPPSIAKCAAAEASKASGRWCTANGANGARWAAGFAHTVAGEKIGNEMQWTGEDLSGDGWMGIQL